jgi:hypothetical protein
MLVGNALDLLSFVSDTVTQETLLEALTHSL